MTRTASAYVKSAAPSTSAASNITFVASEPSWYAWSPPSATPATEVTWSQRHPRRENRRLGQLVNTATTNVYVASTPQVIAQDAEWAVPGTRACTTPMPESGSRTEVTT